MTLSNWYVEPISKLHDRASFDCGESALNDYLKHHACQNHVKGVAKTFLAISEADHKTILGFYSLCPGSIEFARLPEIVRKGVPRHDVPVFRLARLAVDLAHQGRGLGAHLVLSAGKRCLLAATEIGGVALIIDAKNQRSAKWYESVGALPLADSPLKLVLPLATIEATLALRKK